MLVSGQTSCPNAATVAGSASAPDECLFGRQEALTHDSVENSVVETPTCMAVEVRPVEVCQPLFFAPFR